MASARPPERPMGYSTDKPYAMLMSGRPEDADTHKGIAVYSRHEYEIYRAKGWKDEREFSRMVRRADIYPKGYWEE